MSVVGELERSFEQLRPRLDTAFGRWRRLEPALGKFATVEEFVAFCRDQNPALYSDKNDAIASLCRLATTSSRPQSRGAEAGVVLIYLFSGALRNIAKEIGSCLLSLDELDSEMLAGFWEEAARVRTSSRGASTRLYHAARRRAWEAVAAARQHASSTAELNPAILVPSVPSSNPSLILERALQEGVISEIQAELIGATRIERAPTTAVATSLGLTRQAATMQRTRAARRLAAWLSGSSD